MHLADFIKSLSFTKKLDNKQIGNLESVKASSKVFHQDADTLDTVSVLLDESIDENTIVLESGHQPNFLPHPATFKKIFMLDLFSKRLREQGYRVLPLFGFGDLNISTPSLLTRNKIPAFTREGFKGVGFRLKGDMRYKSFNLVDKPSSGDWDVELDSIKNFYLDNARLTGLKGINENLDEVFKVIGECFEQANNFAELNSFIISQICNKVWGLNVLFFRYSDVQQDMVLVDEAYQVFNSAADYNRYYNEAVDELDVGLSPVDVDSYPFWFHCGCGVKIPLTESFVCRGCGQEHDYTLNKAFFRKHFMDLDYSAVCRDLVYAEGLGTSLFFSGVGGSLRYGRVSDYVGGKMGLYRPRVLGVGGKDYYFGVVHQRVLREFTGFFNLLMEDLLDEKILKSKIQAVYMDTKNSLADNPLEKDKYEGRLVSLRNQLVIVGKVFGLSSSVLDLFVLLGVGGVGDAWGALSGSIVEGNRVDCSLCYDSGLVDKDSVPKYIGGLSGLEVIVDV